MIHPSATPTRAVISGALAYGLALAVGELLGGWLTRAGAPLVAVGQALIDTAPEGPRKFAIQLFGTSDKPALVWGIAGITVLIGAVVGLLGRKRWWIPYAGLAVLAAVGTWATATQTTAGLASMVPSVVGALAGGGVLWLLEGGLPGDERAPETATGRATPVSASRRNFLVAAGATVAVGAAAVAV